MSIYAVELPGIPQPGCHAYGKVEKLRFNLFLQLQSADNIYQSASNEIERRGCQPVAEPHTEARWFYRVQAHHLTHYDDLYNTLYLQALENGSAVIALDDTPTTTASGSPQLIEAGPLKPIDH